MPDQLTVEAEETPDGKRVVVVFTPVAELEEVERGF